MAGQEWPVRWVGRQAIVTLPAEIDISVAGQVTSVLGQALDEGAGVVIADMAGTVFCDGSGARALVSVHRMAVAGGAQLRVAAPTPSVRRLLKLSGASRVLAIYPGVEVAMVRRQITRPE
jgi:anti-sigma B factor antagonist